MSGTNALKNLLWKRIGVILLNDLVFKKRDSPVEIGDKKVFSSVTLEFQAVKSTRSRIPFDKIKIIALQTQALFFVGNDLCWQS